MTALKQIHHHYPQFANFSAQLTAYWQPRQTGCQRYHFDQIYLDLWFGDLHENLPQLGDSYHQQIDCWFLDGFSPEKNPEMWQDSLYQHMFRLTQNGGSFATFTAASRVRQGLQQAGFDVQKRKGFAKKREMLIGKKPLATHRLPARFPYFSPTSSTANDIAIVGGGVASLFLAWSLIERGKKVTLYCKDSALAQNASGNQQGALYPQLSDDDERNVRFYIHSFDYALQRLSPLCKADVEHDFTGVALYGYNDKITQKLQKIAQQCEGLAICHALDASSLSQKIGLPVIHGGVFIPQGGWLSPVQLVQKGFAILEKKGLHIVLNHEVSQPTYHDGNWQWEYQQQRFTHPILVLANGHGITDFPQTTGIPLYPVRGQVSQVPTTPILQQLKCVVCYDGYLTPVSQTGTHCLGASHVRDNADTTWLLQEHQQNIAKLRENLTACDWINEVNGETLQGKVGIRAAFRDRIPMVGAVSDFAAQKIQYRSLYNQMRRREAVSSASYFPDLYVIAGLGSRGLTTAPLLGEILASQICGEPIPLSEDLLHALSPNRTWIRKLLKGSEVT